MVGRKPKPTAIKELEGNQGKRKLNKKEPKPDKVTSNRHHGLVLQIRIRS